MKKLIYLGIIIAIALTFYKYFAKPNTKNDKQNQNPIESVGNYVPQMIDTKNNAQKKIEDNIQKENKRIEDALDGANN